MKVGYFNIQIGEAKTAHLCHGDPGIVNNIRQGEEMEVNNLLMSALNTRLNECKVLLLNLLCYDYSFFQIYFSKFGILGILGENAGYTRREDGLKT